MDQLQKDFELSSIFVRENNNKFSNEDLLKLYSRFKQVLIDTLNNFPNAFNLDTILPNFGQLFTLWKSQN